MTRSKFDGLIFLMKYAINYPAKTIRLLNYNNFKSASIYLKNNSLKALLIKTRNKLESSYQNDEQIGHSMNDLLGYFDDNKYTTASITIDILVPIYNAYNYTVRCIDTVLKNTDVPFNLYLLNDKSTDIRIYEYLERIKSILLPSKCNKLIVVNNEENLGFVKNVNNGFGMSRNDIVILNTDTEVPPNWLSRLIRPYIEDNTVCTVTPFSNCATICSFPEFCKDNVLPSNMSVDEVDMVFSKFASNKPIKVPTGVGFCMFMSRKALNDVGLFDAVTFEKGYGEENDWCRRAEKLGYTNVTISNLFVYHKHGASFGEIIDKSKEERIRENLVKLNRKHPEYDGVVQDYVRRDPNKDQRTLLDFAIRVRNEKKETILYINHSMGGGAKVYLDNLISERKNNYTDITMEIQSDNRTIVLFSSACDITLAFDIYTLTQKEFDYLLDLMYINKIFVNELCSYPIPKIVDFIAHCGVKYDFFVHDFFCACPSLNLIKSNGAHCNACNDIIKCNECLKDNKYKYINNVNVEYCDDVIKWRKMFCEFLEGASEVIVPSESTSSIIKCYYDSVECHVREHRLQVKLKNTFNSCFAKSNKLRIGILGAISYVKGSKVLYDIIERIRKNKNNIEVIIIGYTDIEYEGYVSEDRIVTMTGKYNNKRISDLLNKYQISFVMIPSICPETFSYTASEAVKSGYPILAFDIGACAERIKKYNCGWTVKDISSEAMYSKCMELENNREEIINKANNCLII